MSNEPLSQIISRLDRLEKKIDGLLEFKWKITGVAIFVGAVSAWVFEVLR